MPTVPYGRLQRVPWAKHEELTMSNKAPMLVHAETAGTQSADGIVHELGHAFGCLALCKGPVQLQEVYSLEKKSPRCMAVVA